MRLAGAMIATMGWGMLAGWAATLALRWRHGRWWAALIFVGGVAAGGIMFPWLAGAAHASEMYECRYPRPGRVICDRVTTSPTAKPTATPTPTPIACKDGELPDLGTAGFPGWKGYSSIQIPHGETREFCMTVTGTPFRLAINIGDKTGAAQCSTHDATLIPPASTGLVQQTIGGTNSSHTFFPASGKTLAGVWRVQVTATSGDECANRYTVVSHAP